MLKLYRQVVFWGIGIFIATILWYAKWAVPSADDFCYGYTARSNGLLNNVTVQYQQWTGRYLSTFLLGLFGYSANILLHHYYVVSFVILACCALGVWQLIKSLQIATPVFWFALMGLLMAGFHPRQSLFWLAGGFTYGLACGLFLIQLSLLMAILNDSKPSVGLHAGVALTGVLLAGSNEVVMFAQIGLLLSLLVLHIPKRHRYPLAIVTALIMLASVISVVAPGNLVRANASHLSTHLLISMTQPVTWMMSYYVPLWIILTIVIYELIRIARLDITTANLTSNRSLYPRMMIALTVALNAGLFARAYAMADIGPCRTKTLDFAIVMVIALLTAILAHQNQWAQSPYG